MTKNVYRALFYLSRHGRYPNGIPVAKAETAIDPDILRELIYYDYLERLNGLNDIRITVRGREALTRHILTVTNIVLAVAAVLAAVVSLLLQ